MAAGTQLLEHAHHLQAFALAQAIGSHRIVRYGIAHDVALRLTQADGRAPYLGDGGVIQGEGRPCHNEAILP